jgi:hypothetical protein
MSTFGAAPDDIERQLALPSPSLHVGSNKFLVTIIFPSIHSLIMSLL